MSNLRVMLSPIGSKEQKRYVEVMERVQESINRYGGQNRMFRELNRYFLSLSPVVEGRDNDRPVFTGREPETDLFVGESFAVVESAVPNWIFSMFGVRPYVRVLGRTEDDHQKKDAVEMMLDYDFSKAQVFMESIPIGKSVFKYGTGVAKATYDYDGYYLEEDFEEPYPNGLDRIGNLLLGWRKKKKYKLIVEHDGPIVEWVSVFNFGVDPLFWRIRDMRYVWERRWTARDVLKEEDGRYYELTGKHLYKNLEKIPTIKSTDAEEIYQMDGSDDTSEAMGWSPARWRRQPYAQIRDIEREGDHAVEIIEYWERDAKVLIANGETIIHDGPNPYRDKRIPYLMPKCYELEGYPWGFGLLHAIKSEQEELNSWRNLILRQGRFNVTQVWAVDEDVDGIPHASDIGPGDVIQVPFSSSGKPLTQTIYDTQPLPAEAYQMEDRIRNDIQRKLAYSEGMMFGQEGAGSDTATGQRLASQGTTNRFRLQNAIADFSFLRELSKFFYSRRQQYFKKEQVFRIIGKDGVKFEKLSPEDVAGEFDFEPLGQTLAPNRDVLREHLINILGILKGDPIFLERTDIDEVWMEIWKSMDHQWPERFLLKPPTKQWDPEMENTVLLAGQFVDVDSNEPHDQHIPKHQQIIEQVAGDPEKMKVIMEHIKKHQMYSDAMQQQAAAQEQPDRQQQFAGEQQGQTSVPTQGSLESVVGGGTSG
jgi:hypothetical protein